jgi:hypothetical protein
LSINIGITAGGGNTNVFADLTMKSPLDSLMVGMNYSTGESGRSLGMFSQYNQDMRAYISAGGKGQLPTAGSLSSLAQTHLAASQLITHLADGSKQMNMAGAVRLLKIGVAAHRVEKVMKLGSDLGERGQNQADAANAIKNPNSQSASTGGPKGPKKPEDPEEKEKKEKEKKEKEKEDKKYTINEDNADPSLPVGKRNAGQEPKYLTPNQPTTIAGRKYSGHALDRMRERGITPSAVEDAIKHGVAKPAAEPGKTLHYNPINNISVVSDTASGSVVSARFGVI